MADGIGIESSTPRTSSSPGCFYLSIDTVRDRRCSRPSWKTLKEERRGLHLGRRGPNAIGCVLAGATTQTNHIRIGHSRLLLQIEERQLGFVQTANHNGTVCPFFLFFFGRMLLPDPLHQPSHRCLISFTETSAATFDRQQLCAVAMSAWDLVGRLVRWCA